MKVLVSLFLFLTILSISESSFAESGIVELYGVTLQNNGEKVVVKALVKHRWRKALNGSYSYESALVISPSSDLASTIANDNSELPNNGVVLYEAFYASSMVTARIQVNRVECDQVLYDLIPEVVKDYMVTSQFVNPRNRNEVLANVKVFIQLGPELMKALKNFDLKPFSFLMGVRVVRSDLGAYLIANEDVNVQPAQATLLSLLQAQLAKQCEVPFTTGKLKKKE